MEHIRKTLRGTQPSRGERSAQSNQSPNIPAASGSVQALQSQMPPMRCADPPCGPHHAAALALVGTLSILAASCGGGSGSAAQPGSPGQPGSPAQINLLAGGLGGQGNVDGTGADARFEGPGGIAVDDQGVIYVGDGANLIRKIGPTGKVSSYATVATADGAAGASLAFDSARTLYVAMNDGKVFNIASSGVVAAMPALPATSAVTVNRSGVLLGAKADGSGFWQLTATGASPVPYMPTSPSSLCTRAGGTLGMNALAVDAYGNLYATGYMFKWFSEVIEVSPAGTVTGWSFNCSPLSGSPSVVRVPEGIAVSASGTVYVSDLLGGVFAFTPPAASGPPKKWNASAVALALDAQGTLYLANDTDHLVQKITADGQLTTIAGRSTEAGHQDGVGSAARFEYIGALAIDSVGNLHVADNEQPGVLQYIRKVSTQGTVSTEKSLALPGGINALAFDSAGAAYITTASESRVWKMSPGGNPEVFAGSVDRGALDGSGPAAQFAFPGGLVVDGQGNLFVADTGNSTIRKITPTGFVSTLAGQAGAYGHQDGQGSAARFGRPTGIAVDGSENVFVVDATASAASAGGSVTSSECSYTLRMVSAAGSVSSLATLPSQTVAGPPDAVDSCPDRWITLGAAGSLYISDPDHAVIYKVTSGKVTTVAGVAGSVGVSLGSLPGTLSSPQGLVYANSTLYVADVGEHSLLQIQNVP